MKQLKGKHWILLVVGAFLCAVMYWITDGFRNELVTVASVAGTQLRAPIQSLLDAGIVNIGGGGSLDTLIQVPGRDAERAYFILKKDSEAKKYAIKLYWPPKAEPLSPDAIYRILFVR